MSFTILIVPMNLNICHAETNPKGDAFAKAVEWLNTNQHEDGSWGDSSTAYLDTSEVADYLSNYNILPDNLKKSTEWFAKQEILNSDMAARTLPFIKDSVIQSTIKDNLLSNQNEDGGWGLTQEFESDKLDTILITKSIISDGNTESSVLQKAIKYIIEN